AEELRRALDEEIGRLPEKYRRPVVLCYLEGQTHEEAARRLRCTSGVVRGRLDRARARLRRGLARRGLTPTAGLIVAALAAEPSSAAVPAPLAATTLASARLVASGRAGASATAVALADRVLRSLLIAKVKPTACVLAA